MPTYQYAVLDITLLTAAINADETVVPLYQYSTEKLPLAAKSKVGFAGT